MKLTGRSILAYFTRREEAEEAQNRLRREGYVTVQLDRMSRYGGDSAQRLHNPLTGDIDSLAGVTAGMDAGDEDEAVLIAADASASGLAHGEGDDAGIQERAWVLTVVTEEDRANRAVQILEETGGAV